MLKNFTRFCLLLSVLGSGISSIAQKKQAAPVEKCATMPRLSQMLQRNPALKSRFAEEQAQLTRLSTPHNLASGALRTNAAITIPVVFHVILSNPDAVTNAQIQAQLDTLNKSFSGNNGDSLRIPAYFKPLFAKSNIQFCLAQRTPEGNETTGIIRKTTTRNTFDVDDAMKHASSGGADSWNTDAYLNIWIVSLSGGVLGYATFPNDGAPLDQGVVVDYRSLPGGSFSSYSAGKTLVHEVGHYFNLYHIWGDDNGLCTGTDYIDDTPNQANSTNGCFTGIRTDNCTSSGNGIMYQNYMDYSFDACLVMFTPGQISRMENAISMHRPSLINSSGCQPILRKNYDVELQTINSPAQRLCGPSFTPSVTIRNNGLQTLSSMLIHTQVDNGPVSITTWTGSLSSTAATTVSLGNLSVPEGIHTLTIYTSSPNNVPDEERSNDTLRRNFQYFAPVTSVSEGFEGTQFPPTGWDIVNPDGAYTWERVTTAAKTGLGSVMINNSDYAAVGQKDDLRLPQFSIPATVDSAFFTFQVAAAAYTELGTPNNVWDTLEVLISADCGQSYTSLYRKWADNLVTYRLPVRTSFVPTPSDWRKDSINLAAYIGQSNLLLTIRNTTGYENNIYLDDINLRTVTVNSNLKKRGFLVTPNPARGQIAVQFYPQPTGLRGIQLFNAMGQKLSEIQISSGQANNHYTFDLSRYAAGTYYVRALFADRILQERILKL